MNYLNAPNKFVKFGDMLYAYRIVGKKSLIPLVLLQHFRGSMDNWDPAFINALAEEHTVITFDNKGVGLSEGETPDNFAEMGDDAASFINALGYEIVDILGFSIGGAIAQELTVNHPQLVRKLILAATAPKGGEGINQRDPEIIKIVSKPDFEDEDFLTLFFEPSARSQELGRASIKRRMQRKKYFDAVISTQTAHAHAKARQGWGLPADASFEYLKQIKQPVLVANGKNDIMMFTINSYTLFEHLPNARLLLYPDSGHGFLFQNTQDFAKQVCQFL